ncbi:uncharacterized protein LOC143595423 [Bidens hawaiensis]|uniref:uncharacterized protein LOC143595423 n=1 Tax=Bidens hawaiensis TaxID=980011 RepID=UPI00404B0AEC
MDPYNLPVAKRTRLQKQLGFNGTNIGFSGSRNRSSKRNKQECHEVVDVDDDWIENIASETTAHRETDEDVQTSWKLPHGNQNNTKVGSLQSNEESFSSSEREKNDFDLLFSISNKTSSHPTTNPVLVLDISDSDEHGGVEFVNLEELEDSDVDLPISCTYDHGSQMDSKASSFQSTEDELFSSSESESDDLDDADFSLINKRPHQRTQNNKEQVWSRSAARKVKSHSVHKTSMETAYGLITDESSDSNVIEKQNAQDKVKDRYTKVDTANHLVKNKKSKKGDQRHDENNEEQVWSGSVAREEKNPSINKTNMKTTYESIDTNVNKKHCAHGKVKGRYTRVDQTNPVKNKMSKGSRRDNGSCIEAILNSIIINKEVNSRNVDDPLPLFFRFDESEDESSKKTDEYNGEELFQEMDFAFKCDEIGTYGIPMIENQEKDDCYDDTDICNGGKHGDIYFEEQTGLRCRLCGAVLVESKDVIPKLVSNSI